MAGLLPFPKLHLERLGQRVWRITRRQVTHNRYFNSRALCQEALSKMSRMGPVVCCSRWQRNA